MLPKAGAEACPQRRYKCGVWKPAEEKVADGHQENSVVLFIKVYMAELSYRVFYERLAEGGYQVIVPALPEIITYGRTLDEAREMAQDAILCHIKGLLKDGEEIPEDSSLSGPPICEELQVSV